jgi:hypothetical protein
VCWKLSPRSRRHDSGSLHHGSRGTHIQPPVFMDCMFMRMCAYTYRMYEGVSDAGVQHSAGPAMSGHIMIMVAP